MSLFDDFNREMSGQPAVPYHEDVVEPVVLDTGFVNVMPVEDDGPIFDLERVHFKLNSQLDHLVISNNILCMALENNTIVRLDLSRPRDVEYIESGRRPEDRIHKIFLDPSGQHLLISLANGDLQYLHQKWKKPKPLTKARGFLVEAVGWNRLATEATTKEILVGTNKGVIYELEIEPIEETLLKKQVDKSCKQIHRLPDGPHITGLRLQAFPQSSRKYFIMATTPKCIYAFVGTVGAAAGGSLFETIFQQSASNEPVVEMAAELASSDVFFYGARDGQPARAFAWLTTGGIYRGSLSFSSGDNVIDAGQLQPYPELGKGAAARPTALSVAVTEFHYLLLYPDRVVAICRLNDKVVLQKPLERTGDVRRFAVDEVRDTMWLYTSTAIYEVLRTKEDRDIWEVYLENQQYDLALDFAKNPIQRDKVLTAQADSFFEQGKYPLAATYYAQTQKSFEEITLKFVRKEQRDALKTFLLNKLDTLRPGDATQLTVISTWLVEIYLDKLVTLRERGDQAGAEAISQELRAFLSSGSVKDHLNHSTTYNLMNSYGCADEMVEFAKLVEDHELVISHYIQQGTRDGDRGALLTMSRQSSPEMFYKFSPTLIERLPAETVDVWLRQGNALDPKHLIPALMKYQPPRDPTETNQAIRYLQACVKNGNTDPSIHNFLLSLYAQQADDSHLLAFLKNAEVGKTAHFDLQYALRLCTQHSKTQACIYIYSAMGLYEEAVELALRAKDLRLAQINADKPEEDESLRRKLWLRIARSVVEEEKDIKKAMDFLKETDLLKIEDILPFFPDFVLIDHFKDQICHALEEYNQHIDELKQDMDEATRSAEAIRLDIRELRNKSGIVAANGKCNLCTLPLLTRQFYLFPCQHFFHADCLTTEVTRSMSNLQRQRVLDLQQKLSAEAAAPRRKDATSAEEQAAAAMTLPRADQYRAALDDMIAGECPLCGDLMIKLVERPFLAENELDVVRQWEI